MFRRVIESTLAACAVSAVVIAQSSVVVPAGLGLESKYGNDVMDRHFLVSPGSDTVSLYSASGIGLPHGAVIRELAFRPSAPTRNVLNAAMARITIFLGYPATGVVAERLPADADAIVDGGLVAMKQVASTVVALPAFDMRTSPRAFSIRVPIQAFTYDANRGGLVVRVWSNLVSSNVSEFYSIDAVRNESDAIPGTRVNLFSFCAEAGVYAPDLRSFVPGGVGALDFRGSVASQAIAFAGLDRSSVFPVDLSPIGMTNCGLWTTPLILLPTRTVLSGRGTYARLYLPLPEISALSGVKVRFQSIELDLFANRAGWLLHSGVEVEIGRAGTRAFRVATLELRIDDRFSITDSYEYGPVMQLVY